MVTGAPLRGGTTHATPAGNHSAAPPLLAVGGGGSNVLSRFHMGANWPSERAMAWNGACGSWLNVGHCSGPHVPASRGTSDRPAAHFRTQL